MQITQGNGSGLAPARMGGLHGVAARKGGQDGLTGNGEIGPTAKGLLGQLDGALMLWRKECTIDTDYELRRALVLLKPHMSEREPTENCTVRTCMSQLIKKMALDAMDMQKLDRTKGAFMVRTVHSACSIVNFSLEERKAVRELLGMPHPGEPG